jgi:Uma2 family endonuclease
MKAMAPPDGRDATYDDLRAYPEQVHAEIIDGQIVVNAESPLPMHSKSQRALGRFIGGPFDDDDGFDGPGGWWIFLDIDIRLGKHVMRPDLAGWRRERLVDPNVRPITVTPDWLCEVTSPSNEAHDRVTKRRLYAENGVPHYWIVDPAARTLEALTLEAGRWVDAGSFDETATARIPPFESVELPVGRLFLPRP